MENNYQYFGLYKLTVSHRRTYNSPLKDCLEEELKYANGHPLDNKIYPTSQIAKNAACDQRYWLKRDRELSRSSYMFTERIVMKKCNIFGEIKGLPHLEVQKIKTIKEWA